MIETELPPLKQWNAAMDAERHFYRLLIREHHLDTFGHVNNATILQLCEEARWDLINSNGYGMQQIQTLKEGPVILEVTVKYLKELLLRQEIVIETYLLAYPKKVGQIKQVIRNQADEMTVDATFTFGLFDLKERRLIAPTPAWKKAIGMRGC